MPKLPKIDFALQPATKDTIAKTCKTCGVILSGSFSLYLGSLVLAAPSARAITFTTLFDFNFSTINGYQPSGSLAFGIDGTLYGTTYSGGQFNGGTLFSYQNGNLSTLVNFNVNFNGSNGAFPEGGVVFGPDGILYGTTYSGGQFNSGTLFSYQNGNLSTLINFNGVNGRSPTGNLAFGPNGTVYGVTQYGGNYNNSGTLFSYQAGNLSTLIDFNGANGSVPIGGLSIGPGGTLYGTTSHGGSSYNGTLFSYKNGSLSTLSNFNYANGSFPIGGLSIGPNDTLYGTTLYGGADGSGTLFSYQSGQFSTLVNFNYGSGSFPYGNLVFGPDGTLYGRTIDSPNGIRGTLFSYKAGNFSTLIDSIPMSSSPYPNPVGGLAFGPDGAIYGTTNSGGKYGLGTLFRITGLPSQSSKPVPEPSSVPALLGLGVIGAWASFRRRKAIRV